MDSFVDHVGDNETIKYEREHSSAGRRKLEQILGKEVQATKKFVDRNNKFLISIPDGLIDDDRIVEIKCPMGCSKASMETLAKTEADFCLEISTDGRLKLREDHEYYYQVQGHLNISRRELCYFVVWSPTEFHYQVVHRDQHFWDVHMFPWLLDFYRFETFRRKILKFYLLNSGNTSSMINGKFKMCQMMSFLRNLRSCGNGYGEMQMMRFQII